MKFKNIDDSLAKPKTDLNKSNNIVASDLNNNSNSTKTALINSLEKTKSNIDMNKLQDAAGILAKIASINPILYLSLEVANKSSGGASNKYLNNSDSTNNPYYEIFNNI